MISICKKSDPKFISIFPVYLQIETKKIERLRKNFLFLFSFLLNDALDESMFLKFEWLSPKSISNFKGTLEILSISRFEQFIK